jgi:hypothetical protein
VGGNGSTCHEHSYTLSCIERVVTWRKHLYTLSRIEAVVYTLLL